MTTPNLARWRAFHSLIQPRHWGIECGDDGDDIVVAPALSEETAKFVVEAYNKLLERLSRERDTADEHFVVINGPDGACVEVVSGRDRLVETCRNILWSGEGDVPEDVLAILDTVGNPDADEWTEHGAPARLRFDFEDGALEILRVNFMPRAVSRERDTGVPEGFWLAPNEITLWMIAAAHRAGYVFVGATADEVVELTERKMSEPDTVPLGLAQWEAIRTAAPQPPTVSTQGWQDISTAPKGKKILVWAQSGITGAPRTMLARFYDVGTLPVAEGYENEDWAQEVDGEYYMPPDWYEEFEGEEPPAHNVTPTHWMPLPAKPGEHSAPQPDLSTLTRERDQAREALTELQTDLSGVVDNHLDKTEGWIGRELRAKDLPTWWHKVNDILEKSRARSVLDPEKEEKA